MTEEHFISSFRYNQKANQALFNPFLKRRVLSKNGVALISHILQAQFIWADRVSQRTSRAAPWQPIPAQEWLQANEESCQMLFNLTRQYAGRYHETISYANTKGQAFSSTVLDIFMHILYHGSYHRGQLALLIRQAGEKPPLSDYIFHIRQGIKV